MTKVVLLGCTSARNALCTECIVWCHELLVCSPTRHAYLCLLYNHIVCRSPLTGGDPLDHFFLYNIGGGGVEGRRGCHWLRDYGPFVTACSLYKVYTVSGRTIIRPWWLPLLIAKSNLQNPVAKSTIIIHHTFINVHWPDHELPIWICMHCSVCNVSKFMHAHTPVKCSIGVGCQNRPKSIATESAGIHSVGYHKNYSRSTACPICIKYVRQITNTLYKNMVIRSGIKSKALVIGCTGTCPVGRSSYGHSSRSSIQ